MIKKLLLVRHAKSDWGDLTLSDFNRPLNERGKNDLALMAKKLLAKNFKADEVVSSPAVRALTTAEALCESVGITVKEIVFNKNIYEASCNQLLQVVNNLDNQFNKIAIFGHNNAITDLVIYLTDADIYNIPTCGMVLMEFEVDDWSEISKNAGKIIFYEYPKKSD